MNNTQYGNAFFKQEKHHSNAPHKGDPNIGSTITGPHPFGPDFLSLYLNRRFG
jgi:hypothetical protein